MYLYQGPVGHYQWSCRLSEPTVTRLQIRSSNQEGLSQLARKVEYALNKSRIGGSRRIFVNQKIGFVTGRNSSSGSNPCCTIRPCVVVVTMLNDIMMQVCKNTYNICKWLLIHPRDIDPRTWITKWPVKVHFTTNLISGIVKHKHINTNYVSKHNAVLASLVQVSIAHNKIFTNLRGVAPVHWKPKQEKYL